MSAFVGYFYPYQLILTWQHPSEARKVPTPQELDASSTEKFQRDSWAHFFRRDNSRLGVKMLRNSMENAELSMENGKYGRIRRFAWIETRTLDVWHMNLGVKNGGRLWLGWWWSINQWMGPGVASLQSHPTATLSKSGMLNRVWSRNGKNSDFAGDGLYLSFHFWVQQLKQIPIDGDASPTTGHKYRSVSGSPCASRQCDQVPEKNTGWFVRKWVETPICLTIVTQNGEHELKIIWFWGYPIHNDQPSCTFCTRD